MQRTPWRSLFLVAAGLALAAVTVTAAETPRILFLTQSAGFKHSVVSRKDPETLAHAEKILTEICKGKFEVDCTQDAASLTPDSFKKYKVVVFYTTGDLPMNPETRKAFFDFVRNGGGFVGFHCATDTWYNVPEYGEMIGGYFDGHPWHEKIGVKVEDQKHPATAHLGDHFEITDEIYQFKNWDRTKVHVLLSLDLPDDKLAKGKRADKDNGLAWTNAFGKGRVFYCALGHREEVWSDERFQKLAVEAIRWAAKSSGK